MKGWWRGFAAGAVTALAAAALLAGGSRTDLSARVTAGGGHILDARMDESALGRALHIPAAAWGEAQLARRSWIVLTTYSFALRLRPEAEGAVRGLPDVQVSARLPGRVVATNAARVSGRTAVWERLPEEPLVLRTRAVHWLRGAALALLLAAALALGRR